MLLFFLLIFFFHFFPQIFSREMLIQKACESSPNLEFCRPHESTRHIRSESSKKHDVFLRWAFVAAKDAQDIEDVDSEELETNRKTTYSNQDYCNKYRDNFAAYCSNSKLDKLEGLLAQFCATYMRNCGGESGKNAIFPTPDSISGVFPTPESIKPEEKVEKAAKVDSGTNYCDEHLKRYKDQCQKEGFLPEKFCNYYKNQCFKLEKVDDETSTKKAEKEEAEEADDSLETPEEFEEHEETEKKKEPEAQGAGAGSDEVTTYCNNYIENFNFYCVGDMAPEHEKFCNSYKKNCPDRVPLKQSGGFLGSDGAETSSSSSGNSGSSESGDKTYLYKGSKKEYCQKFSVNYEYYCKGSIENAEIFTKFCPSYKKACLGSSAAPADPFSARSGTSSGKSSAISSSFPDIENPEASSKSSKSSSRRKKLKKRDCTADCDERIFPHCTAECKCDFSYPFVQKFCNPPPLPLFLNTCRLWYYGCPKYERYHYASQFIYSKAEKGKVLEGPKTQTTFQLLTPSGETLPYKPARNRHRVKRSAENPEEDPLVFWPETLEIDGKLAINSNGTMVHLVDPPPLPKDRREKDEVVPAPDLPRTKKTTGGTSVPVFSDSVFSNALEQYNSLTDARGILHRPRSRSPFTKPGLWEPNPDDPHNRDHANKYYYRPQSVNVDWLQGQLAWGAHWAVPAAGVGGTDGFSAVHFPSLGTFLNIPDDYD